MSRHTHSVNEPHVTETFGVRTAAIDVAVMVFRIKPARSSAPDDEKRRWLEVMGRWVDRFCTRRGWAWNGIKAGTIGGRDGTPSDAFAVAFTFARLPGDWHCFSRMIWEVLEPEPQYMGIPFVVGGLPEIEVEPIDTAEAQVGGETVTIGTQKRREH